MRKPRSTSLTAQRKAELKALAALADDRIEVSDAAEIRDWSSARRGLFRRPVKRRLTLRLDADIVDWFKRNARARRG